MNYSHLLFRSALLLVMILSTGCESLRYGYSLHDRKRTTSLAHALQERETALRAQPNWGFQGRAAFKQGNEGGNVRVEWRQRGDDLQLRLSAPLTRQSLLISGDFADKALCLDGLESGRQCGDLALEQLHQLIGDMPLSALHYWVRGLAEPKLGGQHRYHDQGYPELLVQQEWSIQYKAWHAATASQPALPRRLEAQRGDTRLRLVIDRWHWGNP